MFNMRWRATLLTLVLVVPLVQGWHDLGNADFHCWPLSASANDPVPYSSCPGVEVGWVEAPPQEIKAREPFNVTFELTLGDKFYEWAVSQQDGFKPNFFSAAGLSTASGAKHWCTTTVCPSDVKEARVDNCCVHHVNVHSCPLSQVELVKNGLCGPWIPSDGDIFSHSEVSVGPGSQHMWYSRVMGLYSEGDASLIAHFKIAGMHLALEKSLKVTPRAVCGDGMCDTDEAEACDTCPRDCGRCPLTGWQVALLAVFVVLIIAGFGSMVGVFKYKQRKLLWDTSWVIPYEDIKPGNGGPLFLSQSRVSVNTVSSNGGVDKQIFTQVGLYNGRLVAVKEITNSEFTLSMDIRKEVKQVRSLDHPNLCKFVGGCVIQPQITIVTEYCPKGSLNDLLLNDDVPINWAFRFSFASDIAKALDYLHTHHMYHGHLKSSNCVVDDRWTVKVTDFGLRKYRKEAGDPDTNKIMKDRIYQGPEVQEGIVVSESACADVYAYAIILVEIATRNEPYGDEDPTCLKLGWKPPLPDHSNLLSDPCPCPDKYNKLICKCWADEPKSRPSFQEVRKVVSSINPDKRSPVDLMINMMEKYSKHLETIVSDRTADLEAEKAKTDRLLHSMLPKAIADQLRHGHQIEAEQFTECTIYFSDICGFTNLSGGSTPIQVVAMLNKLYTTFDSIIDQHDVYKVETIGDAYMVVSGVPRKNGYQHAGEISNMAMELVAAAQSFIIPHMRREPLRIRVGIHTGPVCAGVVGLKMPRYCLFGDTVNTASRMESNGEAYRIHISDTTCQLLQKIGGYLIQKRGTIAVKGKGEMTTWWLNGRLDIADQNIG